MSKNWPGDRRLEEKHSLLAWGCFKEGVHLLPSLLLGFVSFVGEILSVSCAGPATVASAASGAAVVTASPGVVAARAAAVVRVADDLVGDALLVAEELLEADDGGEDEGDFADDQGLACDEGDRAEGERDQSGGFQFQSDQKRQEDFGGFLYWGKKRRDRD